MAAYTKIVDFFGLPGCGKSTLVNSLKQTNVNRLKIATIDDIVADIKKEKLWKRITCVSPVNLLYSFLFRLSVPFDGKRKDRSFKNWVKHGILYNYAMKYSCYDIVLVDEGNIQNFVKYERGDDLHNNQDFVSSCKKYIEASPVFIYIYCQVDADTANKRIEHRGRKFGRIDVINDEEARITELRKEQQRFEFFSSLLKRGGFEILTMEMESPTEKVSQNLLEHLMYEKGK